MVKALKQGKIVIVLQGRFAGRKAVVVKAVEDGGSKSRFPYVIVAGIDRNPKKITRSMSQKKIAKRSKVRPFVRTFNVAHVFPTRYSVDLDVKKLTLPAPKTEGEESSEPVELTVDEDVVADPAKRQNAKKALKKVFEEAYHSQDKRKSGKSIEGVKYLYQKLRF